MNLDLNDWLFKFLLILPSAGTEMFLLIFVLK